MTSHKEERVDPRISVLPRQFSMKRALPDLESIFAITIGFTLGSSVVLWCLSAIVPDAAAFAGAMTGVWALTAAAWVWMKQDDGRH